MQHLFCEMHHTYAKPYAVLSLNPCQVLAWTEEAYKRAKGITRELRSTLSLVQVGRINTALLSYLVILIT
jgi:hypothetical protein